MVVGTVQLLRTHALEMIDFFVRDCQSSLPSVLWLVFMGESYCLATCVQYVPPQHASPEGGFQYVPVAVEPGMSRYLDTKGEDDTGVDKDNA